MALTKSLSVTATLAVNRVPPITKNSNVLNLNVFDGTVYDITIDKDWNTTAAASSYGSLYIKPTLNVYDEIVRLHGSKPAKVLVRIKVASDVAMVADNEMVGAIHADSRFSANDLIEVTCDGLLLGRGGRPASFFERQIRYSTDIELGSDGGPAAVSTKAPMIIINSGGISGGAGGGGANSAYFGLSSATSGQSAWTLSNSGMSVGGGGAPFGLRMASSMSLDIISYLNRDKMASLESGLNPYMFTSAGYGGPYVANGVNQQILAWVDFSNTAEQIKSYHRGPSRDKMADVNLAITLPHPLKKLKEASDATGYGGYYLSTENYKNPAKMTGLRLVTQYSSSWTPRYYYGSGAVADTATYAGLFKGGLGADFDMDYSGTSNMISALLMTPQATVDVYRPQFKGAKGGDLGVDGAAGKVVPEIRVSFGYSGGSDYVNVNAGLSGETYKSNPTAGGKQGPLFTGNVTIHNSSGGVSGGSAVVAKYDPNGTFDSNAKGSNFAKTFEGKYYTLT